MIYPIKNNRSCHFVVKKYAIQQKGDNDPQMGQNLEHVILAFKTREAYTTEPYYIWIM